MPKSRPPAHFVGAGFPVGAPLNIIGKLVRVRSLLGNSQVFHGESGRRAVICCRPWYECLALPVLFACLIGMSSGGRVLIPQGNPINNIMADSFVLHTGDT